MTFLGIDPGISGGLAILYEGTFDPTVYAFKDMTVRDIVDCLRGIPIGEHGSFAMLESVHSFPGQGVASSFKFGQHFGQLIGILAGSGIAYDLVSPQKWQKELGCLSKGDKNITKAAAQRLFPSVKVTHAIADALLLAEFCRRTVKQRNGHI